jgi:hypothetical protein
VTGDGSARTVVRVETMPTAGESAASVALPSGRHRIRLVSAGEGDWAARTVAARHGRDGFACAQNPLFRCQLVAPGLFATVSSDENEAVVSFGALHRGP